MPSSSRSTQEMTTTRCRCGCRKSLPEATRRFWNATSATSASGRSAGRSNSLRMPATSGTDSTSNARTGVINLFLEEQEQPDRQADRAADVEHHDLIARRTAEGLRHPRTESARQAITPNRQADAEHCQDDADDLLLCHVNLPSPGTRRW